MSDCAVIRNSGITESKNYLVSGLLNKEVAFGLGITSDYEPLACKEYGGERRVCFLDKKGRQ
jgi:hypothetical protein